MVIDANDCDASTAAMLTDPAAVSITNVAIVDPTCNGDSDGSITITASGGTGNLMSSIDNGTSFQSSGIFNELGAATYNIVVIDANDCDASTAAMLTDPAAINVSLDLNSLPTLTANESGADYQWLDCNNSNQELVGETGQSFTPLTNGNFAVEITVGSCVDTSECVNVITVGISDPFIVSQLLVYPNPNAGLVNMDLGNLSNVSIQVFNTQGTLVMEKEGINQSNYQFELNEEPGLYLMKVISEGKEAYIQLMRQ